MIVLRKQKYIIYLLSLVTLVGFICFIFNKGGKPNLFLHKNQQDIIKALRNSSKYTWDDNEDTINSEIDYNNQIQIDTKINEELEKTIIQDNNKEIEYTKDDIEELERLQASNIESTLEGNDMRFNKDGYLLGKNGQFINPIQLKIVSEKDIYRYRNYAAIAYCKPQVLYNWSCIHCAEDKKLKVIAIHKNPKTESHLVIGEIIGEKKIVISFRGSSKWKNYLYHTKYLKKKLLPKDNRFDEAFLDKIQVHSGILDTADSAIDDIVNTLTTYYGNSIKDYSLLMIGHSLGGALAALCAIRIENYIPNISFPQITLITYGQPKIGNPFFAQWFNSLPMSSARVVSQGDIVPHFFPGKLNFAHFNNEFFIPKNSTGYYCLPPGPPPYEKIQAKGISLNSKHRLWKLKSQKDDQGNNFSKKKIYYEDPNCFNRFGYQMKMDPHLVYLGDYITCRSMFSRSKEGRIPAKKRFLGYLNKLKRI